MKIKYLRQIQKTLSISHFCFNNNSYIAISKMRRIRHLDLFFAMRHWLNNVEVNNCRLARRLCKLIPAQCPFARKIKLFERTLFTIPPLCKLNPLYEEILALRFRAICHLAERCNQDLSACS